MPDNLNHTHQTYPNFVLENEFEDQYDSKLDLMRFCTVDNSLVGVPGDKKKINVYSATDGTETLVMGEGNTQNIEVSYITKEYEIELLQNRFPYYDEEEMRDPLIVQKGLNHMAVDMFNTANGKAMAEFRKAQLVSISTKFDFNAFVDAVALFPDNEAEQLQIFALVNPKDKAEIRKELKDELKYIEAFVRTGYIGTVNGVNLYGSNIVTKGEIIFATKEAVTYFNKKGTEVEQEREPNTRLNKVYSRKYGIFAFTNAKKAVKLMKYPTSLLTLSASTKASSTSGSTILSIDMPIPDGYKAVYKTGTSAATVTLGSAVSSFTDVPADGVIAMGQTSNVDNTHLTVALVAKADDKPIAKIDLTGATLKVGA